MAEMESPRDLGIISSAVHWCFDWRLWSRVVLLLAAILVLLARSLLLAVVFHAISRLTYVLLVTFTLRRRSQVFPATPIESEQSYWAFRRRAALAMECDAFSFVVLVVTSKDTLSSVLPVAWVWILGAFLTALGIGCKVWAVRSLGSKAYFWYDFFIPPTQGQWRATGPYRFLRNPMYTVGYAQAYGIALLFQSVPGLLASFMDQALILAFYFTIERPHLNRLYGRGRLKGSHREPIPESAGRSEFSEMG